MQTFFTVDSCTSVDVGVNTPTDRSTPSLGRLDRSRVCMTTSRSDTFRISTYNRFAPLESIDAVENDIPMDDSHRRNANNEFGVKDNNSESSVSKFKSNNKGVDNRIYSDNVGCRRSAKNYS